MAEEPLVAPVPRRKLSSIGIQVGGETAVVSRASTADSVLHMKYTSTAVLVFFSWCAC